MRKHQAAFSPFPVYINPSHFFLPRAVRAAGSRSSSFLFCLPAGTKFLIAARAASRPTPCGVYRDACIFTVQARPAACNQNFLKPPAAAGGAGYFYSTSSPSGMRPKISKASGSGQRRGGGLFAVVPGGQSRGWLKRQLAVCSTGSILGGQKPEKFSGGLRRGPPLD